MLMVGGISVDSQDVAGEYKDPRDIDYYEDVKWILEDFVCNMYK